MTEKDVIVVLTKLEGLEKLFLEKFASNDCDHHDMKEHFTKLNGQVAKNTSFRNKSVGIYLGVSTVVGSALMVVGLVISAYI